MGKNSHDDEYRGWLIFMFVLEGVAILVSGFAESQILRVLAAVVGVLLLLLMLVAIFHRLGDLSKLSVALRHFDTWCRRRGFVLPDGLLEWRQVTYQSRPAWRAFVCDWGSIVYIFQDTGDIYLHDC